jgi:transcriptional regulator with XRE-family HTH domain
MSDKKRQQELAQFLRTRRERLSPEAAGLPAGSRRRTPGLRREELAQLAGIGVTWYTRLEQGQDILVSPQVTLAQFRASADRYVREPWFKDLVAELQRDSPEFREWWPRHDIQSTCNGQKEICNPLVGWFTLQSNTFQVVEAPDLRMTILVGADAEAARKLIQLAEPVEAQLAGKK